jgi:hypothetical protein
MFFKFTSFIQQLDGYVFQMPIHIYLSICIQIFTTYIYTHLEYQNQYTHTTLIKIYNNIN